MGTLEPIALSPRDAAAFIGVSKRTLSRLIQSEKIAARKAGVRTLVDVASLKAYYESLPLKTNPAPIVFAIRSRAGGIGRAKEATECVHLCRFWS